MVPDTDKESSAFSGSLADAGVLSFLVETFVSRFNVVFRLRDEDLSRSFDSGLFVASDMVKSSG